MSKQYFMSLKEKGDKVKNNKKKLPSDRCLSTAKRSVGAANWVVLALLVLLIAGAGGGFYLWQKTQQEIVNLHAYVTHVETNLKNKSASAEEFQRKLSQVSAESKSQDIVLNNHLKELEGQVSHLDGQFEKVSNATLSNEVWLLSEAEYLLKTADHRILMKEDVAGAIRILKSTDNLLKKMPVEDKGLLNVRVALANDIASLQALKDIDVLGTYAQLTALGDQIERLPLVQTDMASESATGEKKTPQPTILAKINDTMGGYLTIKKHDKQSIQALLSEESGFALKSSIALIIEQTQTALLRGDQVVYDRSLARLRSRVHQYFVADNFKVNLVIKKIDALLKVQVKNDLPEISGSQQALKRYLSDRARKMK